jgi:DNA-binding response OmpR family regulator
MSIKTYEKKESAVEATISSEYLNKHYTVLLISQNSADIFLVNKLLNELGNFNIHEVNNLKEAQKVLSYLTLDLIIVDDKLPTVSGYEIINRLNRSHVLKDVPKVMLLTNGYNENIYIDVNFDNIDFVKKPIDKMIFKTRIKSILKNQQDKFMSGSIFENMIDTKISEAKEFLKIYKSFLDIDHNLLFVYDKKSNKIVETNKVFNRFFGESRLFNKIIANPRLLRRFVPANSDPSYLNNHHISTWLDLIISAKDFNFLLTVKNRSKEYTFNVLVNKLKLFKKEMYIVKLSNHNIDLIGTKQIKMQSQKINSSLIALRDAIEQLEPSEEKDQIEQGIRDILNELQIPTTNFEKQITQEKSGDDINVYFEIAKILKERINPIKATLNARVIDNDFKLEREHIYAKISSEDLDHMIRGILESYHDMDNLKVDINLFQFKNSLKIEMITSKKDSEDFTHLLVNTIHKIESYFKDADQLLIETAPKQVQNALDNMHADIKTYFNGGENIFLITIPL